MVYSLIFFFQFVLNFLHTTVVFKFQIFPHLTHSCLIFRCSYLFSLSGIRVKMTSQHYKMKKTSCSVCACKTTHQFRTSPDFVGIPESRSTNPKSVAEQKHKANDNGMLSRVVLQQLKKKKKKKQPFVQVYADNYQHCQSLDKLADLTRQKNKQICKHIYQKAELQVKNQQLKLAILNPTAREQQLHQQIYQLQNKVTKLTSQLQENQYRHKEEIDRLRTRHQEEINTMRNTYGKVQRRTGQFTNSSTYQPVTTVIEKQSEPLKIRQIKNESPHKYHQETISPTVIQYQTNSQLTSGGSKNFSSSLQNNNVVRYSPETRIQNSNFNQTNYTRQLLSPSQQTSNSPIPPRSYSPSKQISYSPKTQTSNTVYTSNPQTLYSPLSQNAQTVISPLSATGQTSNTAFSTNYSSTNTYNQPKQHLQVKQQITTKNASPGFSNVFTSETTQTQNYPIQYTSSSSKGVVQQNFIRQNNSPQKYMSDSSKNTTSNTYIYKQEPPKENSGNRIINSTYQQYSNNTQYAPKKTIQTEVSPNAATSSSKTVTFASNVQSHHYSKGEALKQGQQSMTSKGVTAKQIDDIYKRYCLTDA